MVLLKFYSSTSGPRRSQPRLRKSRLMSSPTLLVLTKFLKFHNQKQPNLKCTLNFGKNMQKFGIWGPCIIFEKAYFLDKKYTFQQKVYFSVCIIFLQKVNFCQKVYFQKVYFLSQKVYFLRVEVACIIFCVHHLF